MRKLLFGTIFGLLSMAALLVSGTKVFAAPPPCNPWPPAVETYIGSDCFGPPYADCLNNIAGENYNGYKMYHYRPVWHGYFDTLDTSVTPPDPANPARYIAGAPGGSAPCNVIGDNTIALQNLDPANPAKDFELRMDCFLQGKIASGGICIDNGNDYPNKVGAAFVIDNMLNYQPTGATHDSRINNGIQNAINNLSTFDSLVDYYATSTDPAKYGVIWNYAPTKAAYCASLPKPINNSAYSPDIGEPIFWQSLPPADPCGLVSTPMIRFYWPGGGLFDIGQHCANIQYFTGPIPVNHTPTGSVTLSCSGAQQVATVKFNDLDDPTAAYITTGSWPGPPYPPAPPDYVTSSGATITIPPTATSPYNPQSVTLYVQDTGPIANNAWVAMSPPAKTDAPCVTLTCSSPTVQPVPIDLYMGYTLTVGVISSTDSPPPPPMNMSLQVVSPLGTVVYSQPTNSVTASGTALSSTFNPPPTGGVGQYTANWALTIPGKTTSCSGTFTVTNLPYLSVYGGDTMVGGAPNGAGSCSTNAAGGIASWNMRGATYTGAGDQYAVMALGTITGYASGQGSGLAPAGLSFANTGVPVDPANGIFGGAFAPGGGIVTGDCDFTKGLGDNIKVTGPVTIDGHTVPHDTPPDLHYVINGDAFINGDIVYDTTGWGTAADIPLFKLVVVGGNIYIGNGVKELDGLYVAEPSGGVGGTIYTCATGPGASVDPGSPGYYGLCNNPLKVYGAFVGKQVRFLRTSGSVGNSAGDTAVSNHAAESFIYTPELWLPRGGMPANGGYNAITGLPPVL